MADDRTQYANLWRLKDIREELQILRKRILARLSTHLKEAELKREQ